VTEQAGLGFGGLLRQLRTDAGLTQDELAQAAQVSQRAVSDLERGINRTARKDTAVLLAGALGLDGPARDLFVAAARGRVPAEDVLAAAGRGTALGAFAAAATRALPRDIAGFTGRQAELARVMELIEVLAADGGLVGIHAIDGMAGIGKTTFAVHAAHRLAAFPRWAVLPAAARPYCRSAAGRSGRCAGQLAADRGGARGADPAGAGSAGRAVAGPGGG
jgi:transcriptional regulator with XRE-family HTH domain